MLKKYILLAIVSMLALLGLLSACTSAYSAPARDVQLKSEERWIGTYTQDIEPILKDSCVSCHSQENAANGLNLETYEGVMKGTRYGRVVIPQLPEASALITVLERSARPEIHMPYGKPLLSSNRMKNLELWIKAGAPMD